MTAYFFFFLTNSRYDEPDIQNNIKYNISWKLDIDTFDPDTDKFSFNEDDFKFELLRLVTCNLKCRNIVVNISIQSGKDFHRNVLFIDMKKEIVYLCEPVLSLIGSNDPRFDNLILHSRMYNHFAMLLNNIFDKVFRKTTKPYYLGSYITYVVAKNDELVLFREMVLTRGCAFLCYLFVLCLASVESQNNYYDKLDKMIMNNPVSSPPTSEHKGPLETPLDCHLSKNDSYICLRCDHPFSKKSNLDRHYNSKTNKCYISYTMDNVPV